MEYLGYGRSEHEFNYIQLANCLSEFSEAVALAYDIVPVQSNKFKSESDISPEPSDPSFSIVDGRTRGTGFG